MERFAAIDFETANGKRSSICSIGIAILEDDWVVDSIYTLVRPTLISIPVGLRLYMG